MKSLPMNLSSMKKIGGDKEHSQFAHKDGHVIIIAHSPLPALQRKQLEKLPIHAWEGESDVQAPEAASNDSSPTNNALSVMGRAVSNPQGYDSDAAAKASENKKANGGQIMPAHEKGVKGGNSNPKLQQAKVRNSVPQNQSKVIQHFEGGAAPVQVPDAPDADDSAELDQPPQAQPQANALAAASNPANQVPSVDASSLQHVIRPNDDFNTSMMKANQASAGLNVGVANQAQQNLQAMKNYTDAYAQDLANQHIDPQRFIKEHGKVRTAISLILGGAAQGLMHTATNPAMDWLKTQMQNDIDAQHNEQDKSKSILGAYQHLFGEGQVANAASATGIRDAYKQVVKQISFKQGTPQAIATANTLTDQIDQANNQDLSAAAMHHALSTNVKQALTPSQPPPQPPPQPKSWIDKVRPFLPTGGPSAESGTSGVFPGPKDANSDIDRTIPESEPAPHFRVNDAAIQRAQTAQQAQGEEGDLAGLPPSSSIAQLQKEGAMAKSANAKLDIAHENFKDLWANRADSNAALKYMSDLGVNVGGAHLTLPDLSSLTPRARAYFRAATAIERELGGLVGSGGLTQDQADSIRKSFMREGDTPDDYRKNLKSLDQFILSLPQMQTPAGDTNPGFVTRPKLK